MDTEKLIRMNNDDIAKLTKVEILEAFKYKYSVINKLDEKEKEAERHDKEMKEFRTLIETLASCLNIELPRCSYQKTLRWNEISVPLLMGKMFAEIAKIDYDKELVKKEQ